MEKKTIEVDVAKYLSIALDCLKYLRHVQSTNSCEYNIYLPFVQVFRSNQNYLWFPAEAL